MKYMIFAGLLVAGCGAAVPPAGSPSGPAGANAPDTCNAAAHQGLIGRGAAAGLVLPEPKRTYGPLDAVTTDFMSERLNVQLDGTDTIIAVTCG
jgi:hypothetical protein